MGAWLAPVSQVLTHVSASLRRLDREAGVINLIMGLFTNSEILYIHLMMGPSTNSEILYIWARH